MDLSGSVIRNAALLEPENVLGRKRPSEEVDVLGVAQFLRERPSLDAPLVITLEVVRFGPAGSLLGRVE